MRVIGWAVACALLAPTAAVGQTVSGGAAVTHLRLARERDGNVEMLSGNALGVMAGLRMGPVSLALDYLQGSITTADGVVEEDAVEGEAILLVRPVPGIAIGTGAHARSFVTAAGTQRWVFWEARLHTEAALYGPFRGYFAGWRVLAASVNLVDPFDHGYGVDGGVSVSFGHLPVAVRARYRAERVTLAGGARTQTNERVGIVVTIGRT